MPSLFSQLGHTPILDGIIEEIAKSAIQPSLRAKAYRSLFAERFASDDTHSVSERGEFALKKLDEAERPNVS